MTKLLLVGQVMTSLLPNQSSPQLEEYCKRLAKEPRAKIFFPIAEIYRREGKIAEAIKLCRQGLKCYPNYWGARVTLARACLHAQQTGEARAELELVVKNIPNNLMASKLLGDIYIQEGQIGKVIKLYQNILRFYPEEEELQIKLNYLIHTEVGVSKKMLVILNDWLEEIRHHS